MHATSTFLSDNATSQDKLGRLQPEDILCKNGGDDGGEGADSPDVVPSSRIVGVSASIIFPMHRKI